MTRFFTLITLPFLLAVAFATLPVSTALACSGDSACCKKEVKQPQKERNCCATKQAKSHPCKKQNDTDGHCGKKSCPCPQSSPAPAAALPAEIQLGRLLPYSKPQTKAGWYFLTKIPAAVYLSIWLPPKI